jgi:hypothetical protein
MFAKLFNRNKTSKMSEVAVNNGCGNDEGETYILKKSRPGCTGMFWRSDPKGQTKCTNTSENWPRDNALVRGIAITLPNAKHEKWLLASAVQQQNSTVWLKAPHGAALPFEYDNHYYLEKVE